MCHLRYQTERRRYQVSIAIKPHHGLQHKVQIMAVLSHSPRKAVPHIAKLEKVVKLKMEDKMIE